MVDRQFDLNKPIPLNSNIEDFDDYVKFLKQIGLIEENSFYNELWFETDEENIFKLSQDKKEFDVIFQRYCKRTKLHDIFLNKSFNNIHYSKCEFEFKIIESGSNLGLFIIDMENNIIFEINCDSSESHVLNGVYMENMK